MASCAFESEEQIAARLILQMQPEAQFTEGLGSLIETFKHKDSFRFHRPSSSAGGKNSAAPEDLDSFTQVIEYQKI